MRAGTTGTGARLALIALAALMLALTALPARAAEWETYLSDNFAGPDSMFYTGQAGEAYYSLDNGRYIIDGMSTGVDSLSALTDNLYYYYVEAQCELLDSTAGELAFSGVVFHYNKKIQGKLSYYVFYAYGDGYYGAKRVIGDQVEIVLPLNRSDMLDTGRPNILGVDCQGTRFDLYINGRYVDGFTDVRVDGGGCGFYVSKFSAAAFDNFVVKVEHRGGSVIPPEAPLTTGNTGNTADADPPGIAPDNSVPPGTEEAGHSFLGYKAPVIPKDPNRPVYPWEVGVDKTGKGKQNSSSGGEGPASSAQPVASGSGAGMEAPPQGPPGGGAPAVQPASGNQHPASQAPEQHATQLGNPPPAGGNASPPGVRGDLPHQSIRDAGEAGQPPAQSHDAPPEGGGATPSRDGRAYPPVLPEGEELLPDTAGRTPASNASQASSGSSDVQLVPAGEADQLAAQSAAGEGGGATPGANSQPDPPPSALGKTDPTRAASSVLSRVRFGHSSAGEQAGAGLPIVDNPPPPEETTQAEPEPEPAPAAEPEPAPVVEPEPAPETDSEPESIIRIEDIDLPPVDMQPERTSPGPATEPQSQPEPETDIQTETAAQPEAQPQSGDLALFGSSEAAESEPAPLDLAPGTPEPEPAPEPGPVLEMELTAEPEPAKPASTLGQLPGTGAEPKPSAYFTGPGAVEIADDFTQESWPVSESGPSTYRYFGAAYEVDNLNAETMAISFQEAALADCELSIAAEFLDGASYVGYGAAARFSVGDGGVSYYGLFISRSGELLLLKVVDGVETVLKDWTASTLINPSQANTVTLEIVGARLTAYVNGTAVASVQDADLKSGGYALLAGPGVKVRYDDLLVRGYPAR